MDDSLEKLALMEKCNFSSSRMKYNGFGNAILAISYSTQGLSMMQPEKFKDQMMEIYKNYGFVTACYDSIPFNKLEKDDEDFRDLFKVRDLLPELGKFIFGLSKKLSEKGNKDIENSREYQEVIGISGRIFEPLVILLKQHIDQE